MKKTAIPDAYPKVNCYDWYEDQDRMIMCLSDKNALYEISKTDGKGKILSLYPETQYGKETLSASLVLANNRLFFCPFSADYIAVLDLRTGETRFIKIYEPQCSFETGYDSNTKFYNSFGFGKFVYFLGFSYPAIIKVNSETLEIEYIDNWLSELMKMGYCSVQQPYFAEGYVILRDKVYLPMGSIGSVFEFDPLSEHWSIIQLSSETTEIWGLNGINNRLYYTKPGYANYFYVRDFETEKAAEFRMPKKAGFRAPVLCDNSFVFYADRIRKLFFFDYSKEKWNSEQIIDDTLDRINDDIMAVKYHDGELIIVTKNSKQWITFNTSKKSLDVQEYVMDDQQFIENAWIDKCMNMNCRERVTCEKSISLEYFLGYVLTEM